MSATAGASALAHAALGPSKRVLVSAGGRKGDVATKSDVRLAEVLGVMAFAADAALGLTDENAFRCAW